MPDSQPLFCNTEGRKFAPEQFEEDIHVPARDSGRGHHRVEGWDAVKKDGRWSQRSESLPRVPTPDYIPADME